MNKHNDINISEQLLALEAAIREQNRLKILEAYSALEQVDWDSVPDRSFNWYNDMIEQGNNILYQ